MGSTNEERLNAKSRLDYGNLQIRLKQIAKLLGPMSVSVRSRSELRRTENPYKQSSILNCSIQIRNKVSQNSYLILDLCYKPSLLLTPAILLNPITPNTISLKTSSPNLSLSQILLKKATNLLPTLHTPHLPAHFMLQRRCSIHIYI
jgi:hypothetical protein